MTGHKRGRGRGRGGFNPQFRNPQINQFQIDLRNHNQNNLLRFNQNDINQRYRTPSPWLNPPVQLQWQQNINRYQRPPLLNYPPPRYRYHTPRHQQPNNQNNRPTSPLPGSEEARQRTIAEASARIKEQLNLIEPSSPNNKISLSNENENIVNNFDNKNCELQLPLPQRNILSVNNSVQTETPSKSAEVINKKRVNKRPKESATNLQELRNKIINQFTSMSKGKIQNLVHNPSSTKYDVALQHLVRDMRLNLSSELRNMYNKTDSSEDESIINHFNTLVPDLGVEIANLPDTLVNELSNILQLDMNVLTETETEIEPQEQNNEISQLDSELNSSDLNFSLTSNLSSTLIEPELFFKQAEQMLNNSDFNMLDFREDTFPSSSNNSNFEIPFSEKPPTPQIPERPFVKTEIETSQTTPVFQESLFPNTSSFQNPPPSFPNLQNHFSNFPHVSNFSPTIQPNVPNHTLNNGNLINISHGLANPQFNLPNRHIGSERIHIGSESSHIGLESGHIGMESGHIDPASRHIGSESHHLDLESNSLVSDIHNGGSSPCIFPNIPNMEQCGPNLIFPEESSHSVKAKKIQLVFKDVSKMAPKPFDMNILNDLELTNIHNEKDFNKKSATVTKNNDMSAKPKIDDKNLNLTSNQKNIEVNSQNIQLKPSVPPGVEKNSANLINQRATRTSPIPVPTLPKPSATNLNIVPNRELNFSNSPRTNVPLVSKQSSPAFPPSERNSNLTTSREKSQNLTEKARASSLEVKPPISGAVKAIQPCSTREEIRKGQISLPSSSKTLVPVSLPDSPEKPKLSLDDRIAKLINSYQPEATDKKQISKPSSKESQSSIENSKGSLDTRIDKILTSTPDDEMRQQKSKPKPPCIESLERKVVKSGRISPDTDDYDSDIWSEYTDKNIDRNKKSEKRSSLERFRNEDRRSSEKHRSKERTVKETESHESRNNKEKNKFCDDDVVIVDEYKTGANRNSKHLEERFESHSKHQSNKTDSGYRHEYGRFADNYESSLEDYRDHQRNRYNKKDSRHKSPPRSKPTGPISIVDNELPKHKTSLEERLKVLQQNEKNSNVNKNKDPSKISNSDKDKQGGTRCKSPPQKPADKHSQPRPLDKPKEKIKEQDKLMSKLDDIMKDVSKKESKKSTEDKNSAKPSTKVNEGHKVETNKKNSQEPSQWSASHNKERTKDFFRNELLNFDHGKESTIKSKDENRGDKDKNPKNPDDAKHKLEPKTSSDSSSQKQIPSQNNSDKKIEEKVTTISKSTQDANKSEDKNSQPSSIIPLKIFENINLEEGQKNSQKIKLKRAPPFSQLRKNEPQESENKNKSLEAYGKKDNSNDTKNLIESSTEKPPREQVSKEKITKVSDNEDKVVQNLEINQEDQHSKKSTESTENIAKDNQNNLIVESLTQTDNIKEKSDSGTQENIQDASQIISNNKLKTDLEILKEHTSEEYRFDRTAVVKITILSPAQIEKALKCREATMTLEKTLKENHEKEILIDTGQSEKLTEANQKSSESPPNSATELNKNNLNLTEKNSDMALNDKNVPEKERESGNKIVEQINESEKDNNDKPKNDQDKTVVQKETKKSHVTIDETKNSHGKTQEKVKELFENDKTKNKAPSEKIEISITSDVTDGLRELSIPKESHTTSEQVSDNKINTENISKSKKSEIEAKLKETAFTDKGKSNEKSSQHLNKKDHKKDTVDKDKKLEKRSEESKRSKNKPDRVSTEKSSDKHSHDSDRVKKTRDASPKNKGSEKNKDKSKDSQKAPKVDSHQTSTTKSKDSSVEKNSSMEKSTSTDRKSKTSTEGSVKTDNKSKQRESSVESLSEKSKEKSHDKKRLRDSSIESEKSVTAETVRKSRKLSNSSVENSSEKSEKLGDHKKKSRDGSTESLSEKTEPKRDSKKIKESSSENLAKKLSDKTKKFEEKPHKQSNGTKNKKGETTKGPIDKSKKFNEKLKADEELSLDHLFDVDKTITVSTKKTDKSKSNKTSTPEKKPTQSDHKNKHHRESSVESIPDKSSKAKPAAKSVRALRESSVESTTDVDKKSKAHDKNKKGSLIEKTIKTNDAKTKKQNETKTRDTSVESNLSVKSGTSKEKSKQSESPKHVKKPPKNQKHRSRQILDSSDESGDENKLSGQKTSYKIEKSSEKEKEKTKPEANQNETQQSKRAKQDRECSVEIEKQNKIADEKTSPKNQKIKDTPPENAAQKENNDPESTCIELPTAGCTTVEITNKNKTSEAGTASKNQNTSDSSPEIAVENDKNKMSDTILATKKQKTRDSCLEKGTENDKVETEAPQPEEKPSQTHPSTKKQTQLTSVESNTENKISDPKISENKKIGESLSELPQSATEKEKIETEITQPENPSQTRKNIKKQAPLTSIKNDTENKISEPKISENQKISESPQSAIENEETETDLPQKATKTQNINDKTSIKEDKLEIETPLVEKKLPRAQRSPRKQTRGTSVEKDVDQNNSESKVETSQNLESTQKPTKPQNISEISPETTNKDKKHETETPLAEKKLLRAQRSTRKQTRDASIEKDCLIDTSHNTESAQKPAKRKRNLRNRKNRESSVESSTESKTLHNIPANQEIRLDPSHEPTVEKETPENEDESPVEKKSARPQRSTRNRNPCNDDSILESDMEIKIIDVRSLQEDPFEKEKTESPVQNEPKLLSKPQTQRRTRPRQNRGASVENDKISITGTSLVESVQDLRQSENKMSRSLRNTRSKSKNVVSSAESITESIIQDDTKTLKSVENKRKFESDTSESEFLGFSNESVENPAIMKRIKFDAPPGSSVENEIDRNKTAITSQESPSISPKSLKPQDKSSKHSLLHVDTMPQCSRNSRSRERSPLLENFKPKPKTRESIMKRMMVIDLEIQKLMQEKWDLYKELQIFNKTSGSSSEENLFPMSMLGFPMPPPVENSPKQTKTQNVPLLMKVTDSENSEETVQKGSENCDVTQNVFKLLDNLETSLSPAINQKSEESTEKLESKFEETLVNNRNCVDTEPILETIRKYCPILLDNSSADNSEHSNLEPRLNVETAEMENSQPKASRKRRKVESAQKGKNSIATTDNDIDSESSSVEIKKRKKPSMRKKVLRKDHKKLQQNPSDSDSDSEKLLVTPIKIVTSNKVSKVIKNYKNRRRNLSENYSESDSDAPLVSSKRHNKTTPTNDKLNSPLLSVDGQNKNCSNPNSDAELSGKDYKSCFVQLERIPVAQNVSNDTSTENLKTSPGVTVKSEEMLIGKIKVEIDWDDNSSKEASNPAWKDVENENQNENDESVDLVEENAEVEEVKDIFCTGHQRCILDIKVIGSEFLAASEDGNIYKFNRKTGILNGVYSGHNMAVTSLIVPKPELTNSSVFFSCSLDSTLKCYNLETFEVIGDHKTEEAIQCMDSAWGHIFLGTYNGLLYIYDIKKKHLDNNSITVASDTVLMLKATTEGCRQVLVLASRKREIIVRDAFTGLLLRTMCEDQKPTVYSLLIDRSYVYCGTSDKGISVLDFNSGSQLFTYKTGKGVVCMLIYRTLLFAGCYDGMIYVYSTKTNSHISTIPGPGGAMLLSLAIVDDYIIAGTKKDQLLKIWKIPQDILSII